MRLGLEQSQDVTGAFGLPRSPAVPRQAIEITGWSHSRHRNHDQVARFLPGQHVPLVPCTRPPEHPDVVSHQARSEEHTSELQSLMRISYAVFCLQKNKT